MGIFRIGRSQKEVIEDMEHETIMIKLNSLQKEIDDFNSKVSTMSDKELLEQIYRQLFLIRIKLEEFNYGRKR